MNLLFLGYASNEIFFIFLKGKYERNIHQYELLSMSTKK